MLFTNNGKFLKNNGLLLSGGEPGPALPPYTLRLRFKDGVTPAFSKGTGVLISSMLNIWDLTYENTDWSQILYNQRDLLEIIDSNTAGVVNMYRAFMFCYSLISVPLIDTSTLQNMNDSFRYCNNVETGALALYQQASTQANPPSKHSKTFMDCGKYTETGLAELAQIPNDWKNS